MTSAVSTHVRVLRELGFIPTDSDEEFAADLENARAGFAHDLKVTMPDPEVLAKKRALTYIATGLGTIACDETGREWRIPGYVDLEPFGFKNNTERFRKLLPTMAAEILRSRNTQ